jgi:hypothetical protein
MDIDLSELVAAAKDCYLFAETIKVEPGELRFRYFSHVDGPFSHYYDAKNKEVHLTIQRDAFLYCGQPRQYTIALHSATKKVRVHYTGEDLWKLTPTEMLARSMVALMPPKSEGKIDWSGSDGWLREN